MKNPGLHDADFEAAVRLAGRELFIHAARTRPALYHGLQGRVLVRAMNDATLRDALFRFVDVLPQLTDNRLLAVHLRSCIDATGIEGVPRRLLDCVAQPRFAGLARLPLRRLAQQFLAEESTAGIRRTIARLARQRAVPTFDAVGEAVLGDAEADAYRDRNLHLLEWLAVHDAAARHVSLKLSALSPRFDALDRAGTRTRVFARLAPVVAAAEACGATLTIDMEQHELKPLVFDLFLDLLATFPGHWQPAIALQGYLPETADDIARLLDAAQRAGRRVGVRLVKGAYWDQECAWAAQRHWPLPVFRDKAATDANYERLTRHLLDHADSLHPAIASHNLRSQAVALAHARQIGLSRTRWEAQLLYGMAEPLRDALAASGIALRVYVPTGDIDIGIAYLMRRLLENTASTSILRHAYIEGQDFDALMAKPMPSKPTALAGSTSNLQPFALSLSKPSALRQAQPERETGEIVSTLFTNLPLLDFSRDEERATFHAALSTVRASLPHRHELTSSTSTYTARNPADPDDVLGSIDLATRDHTEATLAGVTAAFSDWRDTPVRERARILRRAADIMVEERCTLATLEVLEAAKPWRDADADVAEAVDFLRYYALQMEALDGWRETVRFPAEDNRMAYAPRGVAAVISPWNFPLAILTGMSSAALVTGNCVVMKPALPGLLIAHRYLDILRRAGVPANACQLLPGDADIGAALVADARVHVVAFTGSRAVGLRILQAAHTPAPGQRHVKQVVCEMGGKNAIIVDEDADLDEAITGILASAFGYSGQKCSACSRLIVVGAVHDRLLSRLVDAAAALPWGPPEDPAFTHGPLIHAAAQQKALDYIEIGKREGRLVWQGSVPTHGCYIAPTIFAGIEPQHRLAREEIFGPVLAVMRAPDFETALDMAMDSDYALTGGVFSRLPAHLHLAQQRFRVGNLYLNRGITGARVGVQPFGGVALSGTGVQAGGPDYLKQFLWSRSVSSNLMRHGFIPEG